MKFNYIVIIVFFIFSCDDSPKKEASTPSKKSTLQIKKNKKTEVHFSSETNVEIYILEIEGLGVPARPYCGYITSQMPPFEIDADFHIEQSVIIHWRQGNDQVEQKSIVSTESLSQKYTNTLNIKIDKNFNWSIESVPANNQ